jgi:hypothetical protein
MKLIVPHPFRDKEKCTHPAPVLGNHRDKVKDVSMSMMPMILSLIIQFCVITLHPLRDMEKSIPVMTTTGAAMKKMPTTVSNFKPREINKKPSLSFWGF